MANNREVRGAESGGLDSALGEVSTTWEALAQEDPLWAICTEPGREGGGWNAEEFFAFGRSEIQRVLERTRQLGLPVVGDGRALDFGCGAGRLTQALAANFAESYGVDVSPTMITLASQYNRFPDTCHYSVNSSSDLKQFDDDQFDFIYSNCVLQHMAPALALSYIREFIRVLAPEGTLVFQVPDLLSRTRFALLNAGFRAFSIVAPRRRMRQAANRLRGKPTQRSPGMRMFTIPQAAVTDAIAMAGGRFEQVDFVPRSERTFHGFWERIADRWNVGFVSKTYFVRKVL